MANCLICYKDSGEKKYHSKCSMKFFGTETMPELELNKKLLKRLAEQTVNERIAVPGVQSKLSVTLEKHQGSGRLTIVGLWGEYILKPQQEKYPAMPENEDLTMHLAELFGIRVCQHTLLEATDRNLVYLSRRFDRIKGEKVHVEDFCQLSEFLTEYKYNGSYEKAGKLILTHCTNSGFDMLRYFELLLFCYLAGNSDMHLKNFSLVHNASSIDLSPAYDLLNVPVAFPKDTEETALLFNGRRANLKLKDFEMLGHVLKVPIKVRENTYKKFGSKNDDVKKMICASFLNDDMKTAYLEVWMKRQQIFSSGDK